MATREAWGCPGDEADVEDLRVRRVQKLMAEAEAARADWDAARQRMTDLTLRENEILTELMSAALDMHEAKMRLDAALGAVKLEAGFLP